MSSLPRALASAILDGVHAEEILRDVGDEERRESIRLYCQAVVSEVRYLGRAAAL